MNALSIFSNNWLAKLETLLSGLGFLQTGLGINQTWQDLTGSRIINTIYTNDTGSPISVAIAGFNPDSTSHGIKIDGTFILKGDIAANNYIVFIVPSGSTYQAIATSTAKTIWSELR